MTILLETTDAPASTLTSYRLRAGDEFHGKLSVGSGDWLAVTLAAGKTYTFGAVGIGAVDTGVQDTKLVLHDASGAVLASDDNGGPGQTSSLTFTAATSATFYIEVQSLSGPVEADYGLAMTLGSRVSYGVALGAAELYREGLSWAATPATATTVSWGFRASGPALDASGSSSTFYQLTAAQQEAAQHALADYSSVANITFQQVNPGGFTNSATILIGAYQSSTDGAGAYAYYPGATAASAVDGDLWINDRWVSKTSLPLGSYDRSVFLHELGHAMGLAHPGDYSAAPGVTLTYQNSAQFVQDSYQYTVMSYFDASATQAASPHHYADTLMMYDIYAVQQLYGVNSATNAGHTVYGFHSTVGGAFDFSVNTAPLLCIWDGSGNDLLDLSGYAQAQRIDLHTGSFSDVGGYKGNVSIAMGCKIENAIGGSGSDLLIGNVFANRLQGRAGDDTIIGGAGNDTLAGNLGADTFVFARGSGHDVITDFSNAMDALRLSASLWGGAVLTGAEVAAHYGVIVDGHVVLDFGIDQISLLTVHSVSVLAAHILVA
ncbi:matrixin family metalloprotease [bacterium]|nr:matrixin family metalloprotease [bacterium]